MQYIADLVNEIYNKGREIEKWIFCVYYFENEKIDFNHLKQEHIFLPPTKVEIRLNKMLEKDLNKNPVILHLYTLIDYYKQYDNYGIVIHPYINGKVDINQRIELPKGLSHDSSFMLHYFDNQQDCENLYNKVIFQIMKKYEKFKEELLYYQKVIDNNLKNLENSFINSNYVIEALNEFNNY